MGHGLHLAKDDARGHHLVAGDFLPAAANVLKVILQHLTINLAPFSNSWRHVLAAHLLVLGPGNSVRHRPPSR
jgi:hypothetical protein